MTMLQPFRAWLPKPRLVSDIAAPPYDILSRDEAQSLTKNNPLSFLHVSRPEIGFPATVDPYIDEVYFRARKNLVRLNRENAFYQDADITLYLYQLQKDLRIQTGVLGGFSLEEYRNKSIKIHEKTRKDKELDRTKHLLHTRAHTGLVFLMFRRNASVSRAMGQGMCNPPLFDFIANDGVRHSLRKLNAAQVRDMVDSFREIPNLYIADGHHRAASANRALSEWKSFKGHEVLADADHPERFMLGTAFPTDELEILPYHRIVKVMGQMSGEALLKKLEFFFTVSQGSMKIPAKGIFEVLLDKKWYEISLKEKFLAGRSEIQSLDVSILQDFILNPVFGIQDPRTDSRLDFVGGPQGLETLESLHHQGTAKVAFALHPTALEDLLRISDQDEIMPPKSTWFEPKLRDGIAFWGIDQCVY